MIPEALCSHFFLLDFKEDWLTKRIIPRAVETLTMLHFGSVKTWLPATTDFCCRRAEPMRGLAVGTLVEVPVMLSVCRICFSRSWYEEALQVA
jgi:hypothetical protein